jgi:two-component system phosphate regulon sensor histidine kinase PhoR
MHKIQNIKWLPVLMAITILAIVGFQVYWINKSYEREERTLDMRTNVMFRETIRNLQTAKLKLDKLSVSDSADKANVFVRRELEDKPGYHRLPKEKMVSMLDVIMQKTNDSSQPRVLIRPRGSNDSLLNQAMSPRQKPDHAVSF